MMNQRRAEFGGAIIVLLGLLFVLYEYHGEIVARARLEATMESEKAHQGDLTRQTASIAQDLKQRLAALEQAKAAAQTPSQIIKEIPVYLPQNLPQPITTVTQPAAVGAKDQTPVVTGALVPVEDMKPIFDQLVACKECEAKLFADEADKTSEAKQLASMNLERDAAIAAVKGGTFWQRLKHDSKTIFISAVAGAVVVCGTGHCK
jgi:hypothetical protein